jgi:hypothetical protein
MLPQVFRPLLCLQTQNEVLLFVECRPTAEELFCIMKQGQYLHMFTYVVSGNGNEMRGNYIIHLVLKLGSLEEQDADNSSVNCI